ncbi:MAG TPA: R3H domain-containing nucleic acid-binding protein [Thermomicrobiales bacterium]|nr:R3H domain-containing nucleic acid-binding protein [Thermomicrobiales bacterium]
MSSLPRNAISHAETELDRPEYEQEITDNIDDLLSVLPPHIAEPLISAHADQKDVGLVEIILDLGRRPEARFEHSELELVDVDVTREDLAYVSERIGNFGDDNRAGIERTLHRISAIRNRRGEIVGLTSRIGRAVFGTIAIIEDLIESGESILLLGRPGVGKTTMLRETARVLADTMRKRVVIVDTSNEIAGDGDIPHPAIGRARRMQVPTPTMQHAIMIEAVENHMPEVVVIDEIGTELEALAARTIAERGVQLIGTAHGNSLENLMMNPTLSDLVGGIQSVTLSDEEARRRGTQKSILERKAPPTFDVMVEIVSRDEVAVHRDVATTVDAILRNAPVRSEMRRRESDGRITASAAGDARRDPNGASSVPRDGAGSPRDIVDISTRQTNLPPSPREASHDASEGNGAPVAALPRGRGTREKPLRLYPFGISRNRLEQAIASLGAAAVIMRDLREADLVITLKNYYRRKPQPLREAEQRGTPVYVLRSNTAAQMEQVLAGLFPSQPQDASPPESWPTVAPPEPVIQESTDRRERRGGRQDIVSRALWETEEAIGAVMQGAPPIALAPQGAYVRRIQHQMADRYNLASRSRGKEPNRRVEIYREGMQ